MNDHTTTKEPAKDSLADDVAVDEPPPFGRSWATLYWAVIINLVLLITLFYIFTKAFE